MKRGICLILSLVLVISYFPVQPAAAQEQTTTQVLPEDLISLEKDPTTEPGEAMPSEPEDPTPEETTPAETLPVATAPEETTAAESMPAEHRPTKGTTTSGTTGDCTWRLDGTVLTISGTGAMADYYSTGDLPWGLSITKVIIESGVTAIGTYAFGFCRQLKEVYIPDSVKEIKANAFRYCVALTKISIPDGITVISNYAFSECTSLAQVNIPNSVTKIGDSAFSGCDALRSVTISENVTTVGKQAFAYCDSLTNVTITANLSNLDATAFSGSAKVNYNTYGNGQYLGNGDNPYIWFMSTVSPDVSTCEVHKDTKYLSQRAFTGCTQLKQLDILGEVDSISKGLLSGCSSLESLTIPYVGWKKTYGYPLGYIFGAISYTNGTATKQWYMMNDKQYSETYYLPATLKSVTVLGGNIYYGAFYNCKDLTEIKLEDGVTGLGAYAFSYCTSLTQMELPDTITELGRNAFSNCSSLTSVVFSDNLQEASRDVFTGCSSMEYAVYDTAKYLGSTENPYMILVAATSTSITSCTIHPDTKIILANAFYNCKSLKSVTMPDGVTSIGYAAFYGCKALKSLKLPNSVIEIGDLAFYSCRGFTTFVIPDSVESIGDSAFYDCYYLTSITIGKGVRKIGTSAFNSCNNLANVNISDLEAWFYIDMGSNPMQYGATLRCNGTLITHLEIPQGIECVKAMAFVGCESLQSVSIADSVTSIEAAAFRGCVNLTQITIPDSVQSIGQGCLAGCTGLQSVTIPFVGDSRKTAADTNRYPFGYLFNNSSVSNATQIEQTYFGDNATATMYAYIPNNLASVTVTGGEIPYGAFQNCTMLKEIVLEPGVTKIEAYALQNCTGLTSAVLPETVTAIGDYAFAQCSALTDIVIPNGVTELGSYAFYDCIKLSDCVVGDDVTAVGSYTFAGCTALRNVTLGKGMTHIGANMFSSCRNLTDIVIPEGVTSIESNAFSSCSRLASITLPTSLKQVGDNAFNTNGPLQTINIPDLSVWCEIAFTNAIANPLNRNGRLYIDGNVVEDLVIPQGTEKIESFAFNKCSWVTNVTIPDSVTSIGEHAFAACSGLGEIILPDSVTEIGTSAFRGTPLVQISIPKNVKTVGGSAFADCTGLKNVTILADEVYIGGQAFSGCTGLTQMVFPSQCRLGEGVLYNCPNLSSVEFPFTSFRYLGSLFGSNSGEEYTMIIQPKTSSGYTYGLPNKLQKVTINGGIVQEGAFHNSANLTEIVIGDEVTQIAQEVFYGCGSLETLTLPFVGKSLTEAWVNNSDEFGDLFGYTEYANSLQMGVGKAYLPAGLQSVTVTGGNIPDSAFSNYSIPQMTIGANVSKIGAHAFYNAKIQELVIEDGVSEIGSSAFQYCDLLTNVTIPGSVNSIGSGAFFSCEDLSEITIEPGVQEIGNNAFSYCNLLTEITIPGTVNSIGSSAFYYCPQLTKVTLQSGVKEIGDNAFEGCSKLTDVSIEEGLTRVGKFAFKGCTNLKRIALPDSTKVIAEGAFEGCTALIYADLGGGLTEIGAKAFKDCKALATLHLPDSIELIANDSFTGCEALVYTTYSNAKYLGDADNPYSLLVCATSQGITSCEVHPATQIISSYAFRDCAYLSQITLPDSISKMGDGVFDGCKALKNVVLPANLTQIAPYTFRSCTSLVSVTTPEALTEIGACAFQYCYELTSVRIPAGVTSIGKDAFWACQKMNAVYISDLIAWCNITFANENANPLNYGHQLILNGEVLRKLTVPGSVTTVKPYTFYNCSAITELEIPNTVTQLQEKAFYGCSGLTNITVPESVQSISTGVFGGCSSLQSITIPYVGGNKSTADDRAFFGFIFGTTDYTGSSVANQYYGTTSSKTYYIPATLHTVTLTQGDVPISAFSGCNTLTTINLPDDTNRIGEYAFYRCLGLSKISLPAKLTVIDSNAFRNCTSLLNVGLSDSLTTIGNYAFAGCDSLASIDIPNSVTNIREGAFFGCDSLESVSLSDAITYMSVGVFKECLALKTITLPKGITRIDREAFMGCSNLSTVNWPDGLESIYTDAFNGCAKLKISKWPANLKEIDWRAFRGCVSMTELTIPDGVVHIYGDAFSGCTGLTSVSIPSSVQTLGSGVFSGCSNLRSMTIPFVGRTATSASSTYQYPFGEIFGETSYAGSVEVTQSYIGPDSDTPITETYYLPASLETVTVTGGIILYGAFSSCESLKRIDLPADLTEIGPYAFINCTGLNSISIPDTVTKIGASTFYGCTSLSDIQLPDMVTQIGSEAFYGCTKLSDIRLPDTVTKIDRRAFANCTALTSIAIPKGISELSTGVFENCSALTSITIPDNVTKIGDSAFSGCTGLRTVSLPDNGLAIGSSAFKSCVGLTSLVIPDSAVSIGSAAFSGCRNLTSITIPFVGNERKTESSTYQYPFGYIFGTQSYSGGTSTSQTYRGLNSTSTTTSNYYIPTGLKTVTVTGGEILYGAFMNCKNLTKIILPENTVKIGNYAFSGCTLLPEITIPDTVTTIGERAFNDCTAFASITIPDGVTNMGAYSLAGCTKLTEVTIPDSVTSMGSGVLYKCNKLTSITIPFVGDSRKTAADKYQYPLGYLFGSSSYTGGVSTKQYYYGSSTTSTTYSTYYIPSTLKTVRVNGGHLLYGAFYNCANIRTIILGEDVTVVIPNAFTGTNSLEAFEVDINNPNYCSHNRILYNKDKTEVIWNPSKHTFILTINYLYADGTAAGATIVKRLKSGVAYSEQIPDILGYSTLMTDVSGTMPFQDLTIDVVYYENPVVARGKCTDTMNWTMYEDGKLVLRGTGAMPDYESGTAPWAAYTSQVKEMYLDPRITSIGAHAFENCSNMTYVDYGRSVDTIGAYAFAGCSALTSFSLPASVTQVAQGAFSGCTGLKAVVIPDNITAIGDDAFLGCSNLVQVTIGGNVTQIGSNAFANCPNLTQVYFRGAPAAVGSNVFGETAGKFVFYYSTISGWEEQIDGDSRWHGYAAFPYNAITGEEVDLDSLYIIKVVDKHNTPLANAIVRLGDQTAKTNDKGLAHFDHKPTQAESLKIECSNHQDFIDEQFSTTSTQLMDVIEMTDKPSYIQGIRLNNRSIATSVQVLDSAKSEQVKIAVSGYSKYKIVKYELCQGSRVISSYSPTNPTNGNSGYIFTVWANAFEEGQTVLVRMYTADGQSVASALNIDVVHLAVISETQIMDEFANLNFTIGLGGLGEYKIPFTVTGTGEEMVYVSVNGRTIRVGINLDVTEIFGKDGDKDAPIGLIHRMVDNAMKNKLDDKTGVIFDLCGYIELEYLGDGEYFLKTTYVKVSVGVRIGFRAQASFFGIVGVYFEIGVSAKGTLELKIARVTPEEGFELEELNFSPEVGVRLEGGAFLLAGAGSAGIYGELTMGFTLGIVPEFEIKTVYITGELGVTWALLWGVFGDDYVIASGDIYRWPEGYSKKEFETLLRQLQTDSSSYTVNDRAYLEERSDWQGSGEYLQTGIYGQVAPKTITCGNTTMMLWLDDNAQRDLSNFQTLYYSLYTDGAWSAPVALDDNGTFDCEFDVCTDGQKIYVIYTERATVASGVETMAASDLESLMAFANGVEVMVSVYENGSFGKPKALTDNQICETSPTIRISGGKLTAAWLESDNVGADAVGAGNTLRTVCLEDGAWGEPTATVSGSNAVGSMTVVTLQDQSCTAYTVDADDSGMTKDDQVLLLKDAQGEVHHLDTGSISRVDAAVVDGNTVLTWNKDGVVYMLTRADAAAVRLTAEGMAVSEHQLLAVDGQTLLLYVNNDRVYGLYLDETGPLTQGVVMASSQGSISGFSATSRKGTVHAVFTETFAEIIDSTVHTESNLRNVVLEFRTDIAVQNPDYQILDVRPLTELTVDVDVTNTGSEAVDSLYVELTDPQGKLVYTTQYAVDLTSGSTQNCQIALVMPQSIAAGEYTLQILPCRGMTQLTDANSSDNSIKLTLAYADLDIQAEQKIIGEKNFIAMTVENQGNTATHAVIEVYAPDRSGRQIATLDTSKQLDPQPIAPGQSVQFFIDIHALTTQADSLVTCVVMAEFADPVSLNNTDTVKLLHLQTDGFVADPDKAVANPELAVNYGVFDKYVPQDITVQINACKEEFSGIEGLIRGTDYTINYKTGVVTLMQSYLSSLETGNYTLVFQFAYDNAASATRAYNLAVTDSTPIQLSGSIAISGEPVVGSTLSADLSGLSYENANVQYLWTVDGVTVSTEKTYTVVPADNEKTLVLTVTGYDGFAGSFTQEAQITLAQVDAPVAPVAGKVEATAITVVGMNGAEYSLDGKTWQASPVFTGLQPNTTYTIYARYAQTDSSFASDASTATVTTPKHARQMGKPTRFETVGAVVHFGDALPTAGIGEGQISYGYSLTNDPATVTVWSAEGVLPQVDTPTTYYVFARITGSDAYEDAVSLGSQVQAHVHQYKDTVVKPTIEAEGYTEHTCVCGDSYKDSFVDKLTYIVGDVNRDGLVNTQDRILLARYLAKWIGYDAERIDLAAADVNGDGRVNTQDRIILARYLAKWIGYEELPANR